MKKLIWEEYWKSEFPTVSKFHSCRSTDDDDGEFDIMKTMTVTMIMLTTMMRTMLMMMMTEIKKIMKWDRLRHGNSQVVRITTSLHSQHHCIQISFEMMMIKKLMRRMMLKTLAIQIDSFQALCWKLQQKTAQSKGPWPSLLVWNSFTGYLPLKYSIFQKLFLKWYICIIFAMIYLHKQSFSFSVKEFLKWID